MDWLRAARVTANLTQEEMSGRVGIARGAYANIETGERRPSVKTAKKIAAVLGFNWTKFFEEDEREKGGERKEDCRRAGA